MSRYKSKKINIHIQRTPGDILDRVNQGFRLQNTSLAHYCNTHNMDRHKATHALLGIWKSRKARTVRSELIEASGANRLPQLIHATKQTQEAA